MMMLGIHGTGKYHCVSLDYIHGSKRIKNVSRNMWMLPNDKWVADLGLHSGSQVGVVSIIIDFFIADWYLPVELTWTWLGLH